jgi:hypothetical protein
VYGRAGTAFIAAALDDPGGLALPRRFWAAVKVAETGKVLASHSVDDTPQAVADIRAAGPDHDPATVGTFFLGGHQL